MANSLIIASYPGGELVHAPAKPAYLKLGERWCSFQVPPRPSSTKIANDMHGYTKRARNLRRAFVAGVKSPNRTNNLLCKGRVGFFFSSNNRQPVFVNPFRVIPNTRRVDMPLSVNGISHIIALSSPSKVGWVATRSVVARMKGVRHSFWCLPISKEARYSAGNNLLATGLSCWHSEYAITIPMLGFSYPRPALTFGTPVNLGPEAPNIAFVHSKHSNPPFSSVLSTAKMEDLSTGG